VLGVRISLEQSLDIDAAKALGYKNDYIQIYSNSYGPSDRGFLVQGPDKYTLRTLQNGVTKVGAIYIT